MIRLPSGFGLALALPLLTALIPANAARSEVTASAAPAPTSTPAPPRLYKDSRVITRDRISVEVIGQGPDLILIPGLASSRETWRATADRLKSHYRLHLIEVAGFAGEPARANGEGPVLIPTAEAIDAYIREQHLSPATVIGHSLGGTMILWLAVHHPEDLHKALVVDALPYFATVMMGPGATSEQVRPMAEAMRHAPPPSSLTPPGANRRIIENMVSGEADRAMVEAWYASSNSGVVANALADDLELDLRPDLAAIHTPILLLYPDNTPAGAPPGAMDGAYKAMFAAAPGIKLAGVDHSLHFIMLDQPAAFAARLDAFLAAP